ncbi:imm11 family protein [Campylobacterota bacterium]
MQYYIFDEVSPNSEAPFLELPDEIDLIETIMGKKPNFDELPIRMEAEIDEDEEVVYTDIINPGVPLFSHMMKSALDQCGVTNIDYYPVLIIDYQTKEVLAEYWLGVVTDIIACIDLDKSSLEENKMGKTVITKFSIDAGKTGGLSLFRFHNIPGLIIIDEVLKEALSKTDFTGVSFKPTQNYCRKV